jgi:hypothetical protein
MTALVIIAIAGIVALSLVLLVAATFEGPDDEG